MGEEILRMWAFVVFRAELALCFGAMAAIHYLNGRTKSGRTRVAYFFSSLLLGTAAIAFGAGVASALTRDNWTLAILQGISAQVALVACIWWIKNRRQMNARDYERVFESRENMTRKLQLIRAKYPNEQLAADIEEVEAEFDNIISVIAQAGVWVDSFKQPQMDSPSQ